MPTAPRPPMRPPRPRRSRRRLLLGAPALAAGGLGWWVWRAGTTHAAPATVRAVAGRGTTHAFAVALAARQLGTPVNRRVLGSNVQWVDNGDDMLAPDARFEPSMLAHAKSLAPGVLRYPGGAQSDNYRWALGMGKQGERGQNNHVNAGATVFQTTRFGTREFLELCEATGAEPLITVNIITGTPDDAAAWLAATNITRLVSSVTGAVLPKVMWWELGNEPYLKQDNRPDLDIEPEEFARRAQAFIRALRAVDPGIRIGLPLTQDVRNGVPVTPYPGFSARVLALLGEPVDYASVHNAYMPFALDAVGDPTRQYWGAMAGARAVQADLAAIRALMGQLRPGSDLPLAVTEYSPLFTLGAGENDNWITTPAGAVYLADVLRVFATTPGLLMAAQWSLSGNWNFGAIHSGRYLRPVGEVLRLYTEALRGVLLSIAVTQVEAVATTSVGLVPAVAALPLVEALCTSETQTRLRVLRVLLIHKDPSRPGIGRLSTTGMGTVLAARLSLLAGTEPFDARDVPGVMTRTEQTLAAADGVLEVTLPPCSVALVTVRLAPA